MESGSVIRSQLGPKVESGFFPCVAVQMVTQPYLLKDSYSQLALNAHHLIFNSLHVHVYFAFHIYSAQMLYILTSFQKQHDTCQH